MTLLGRKGAVPQNCDLQPKISGVQQGPVLPCGPFGETATLQSQPSLPVSQTNIQIAQAAALIRSGQGVSQNAGAVRFHVAEPQFKMDAGPCSSSQTRVDQQQNLHALRQMLELQAKMNSGP